MEKTSKFFSFIGLTVTEEHVFSERVAAAAATNNDIWVQSEISNADLVILKPETALTPILLNRARKNGQPALLFLHSGTTVYEGWPCIAEDIGIEALAACLRPESATTADSSCTFHSLSELAGMLNKHRQADCPGFLLATHDRAYALLLDTQSQTLLIQASPLSDEHPIDDGGWQQLVESFAAGGSLNLLTQEQIRSETATQRPLALDRWLWLLGVQLQTALLPGIPADAQYLLDRWPDFGTLRTRGIYIRLASALIKKPLTCAQITSHFPLNPEDAMAFLNACYLCNYLQWRQPSGNDSPAPVEASATPRQSSMSRLRNSIGIEA